MIKRRSCDQRGVERLPGLVDEFVDLFAGDDQRRRDDHRFVDVPHHDAVFHRKIPAQFAGAAVRLEARPGLLVGDQLDRAEQSERARFADERVIRKLAPALLEMRRRNVVHVFDDPLVAQQFDIANRNCRARRMARVRESMVEVAARREHRGDAVRDHHTADRQIAGRHALGHHEQIRLETVVLRRKPVSCAAEPGDHLVDDEQDSVLRADATNFRPVARRRHDDAARTLDRFADERRDVGGANGFDPPLEITRALDAELIRGEIAAIVEVVRLRDVLDARNRQTTLLVHVRHAAEARAAHRAAVVRIFTADDHGAVRLPQNVPVMPHHADHGVVGFGSRTGEEDVIQIRRRHLREQFGEANRGRMRALKEAVVERQLRHLLASRLRSTRWRPYPRLTHHSPDMPSSILWPVAS